MYFHLSLVVQKTSPPSLLATFKGQKAEYLPSNAFKTTLVLMNVSSITLKSLTRNCSYISSPPSPTPNESRSPSSPAIDCFSIWRLEEDLQPYLPCKDGKVLWFALRQFDAICRSQRDFLSFTLEQPNPVARNYFPSAILSLFWLNRTRGRTPLLTLSRLLAKKRAETRNTRPLGELLKGAWDSVCISDS